MILPRYERDGYDKVVKERTFLERLGYDQNILTDEFFQAILDEISTKQDVNPLFPGVTVT